MPAQSDPWNIPEWHALRREAALVRHLLGSGITSLGRANYADKKGEYYNAFFGLSVGMERLTKLILVADHAISNKGRMPEEKMVRQYGHNLLNLANEVELRAQKYGVKLAHPRPTSAISSKIVECLDGFADARRGRYANFVALGDPNLSQEEPIARWWGEVAELILKEHYHGRPAQARVEARAKAVDKLMSPFTAVLFFTETDETMQDVLSSSLRSGQTELVQRYGRFYALTLIRWLAEVFASLSELACNTRKIEAFFGVYEYFQTFQVPDKYLLSRKIWP